jgi:hypothetical protein
MNLNRAKRANEIPKRGTDPENRCKKFLPQVKFLVVSANSQRYGKERKRELLIERERGCGENKKKTEVEETWKGMKIGREWRLRRKKRQRQIEERLARRRGGRR